MVINYLLVYIEINLKLLYTVFRIHFIFDYLPSHTRHSIILLILYSFLVLNLLTSIIFLLYMYTHINSNLLLQ
jgi:hypothetical protein